MKEQTSKFSLFETPPPTKWNVLNLGAGVQSSCLALMAAKGEITPMPDFAVFADTQAEPKSVYAWLDWLEKQLPFPVYRVTKGDLTKDSLALVKAGGKSKNYGKNELYLRRIIPAFGLMPNGEKTIAIGRKCTADYKIKQIEKCIIGKAEITRGQKQCTVTQWIGISWDELQRMKNNFPAWAQPRWPLIEMRMTRQHCLKWMKENGYPEPPRSACVYCPFHSDTEWRRLRDEEPGEFQRAIEFDKKFREVAKRDRVLRMEVYLHKSCKPLDQVDFDSDVDKGQMEWDFKAECEGMCGI
jgi:hypothetical protein